MYSKKTKNYLPNIPAIQNQSIHIDFTPFCDIEIYRYNEFPFSPQFIQYTIEIGLGYTLFLSEVKFFFVFNSLVSFVIVLIDFPGTNYT